MLAFDDGLILLRNVLGRSHPANFSINDHITSDVSAVVMRCKDAQAGNFRTSCLAKNTAGVAAAGRRAQREVTACSDGKDTELCSFRAMQMMACRERKTKNAWLSSESCPA